MNMDIQKLGFGLQSNNIKSKQVDTPSENTGSERLSHEEKNMISKQFPKGQNQKLELYMSSGSTKTEQPASRGYNFDASV